jgi:hypothetical protein
MLLDLFLVGSRVETVWPENCVGRVVDFWWI